MAVYIIILSTDCRLHTEVRVGLCEICKRNRWVYFASIMQVYWAEIRSILSNITFGVYRNINGSTCALT